MSDPSHSWIQHPRRRAPSPRFDAPMAEATAPAAATTDAFEQMRIAAADARVWRGFGLHFVSGWRAEAVVEGELVSIYWTASANPSGCPSRWRRRRPLDSRGRPGMFTEGRGPGDVELRARGPPRRRPLRDARPRRAAAPPAWAARKITANAVAAIGARRAMSLQRARLFRGGLYVALARWRYTGVYRGHAARRLVLVA